MSLEYDDFMECYPRDELKLVELSTLGGKSLYLRGLPYADVWDYRITATQLADCRFRELMEGGYKSVKWIKNKVRAEDELLKKAIANSDGSLMFDNKKNSFSKWRKNVKNEVVNEILYYIKEMNTLDDSFDLKADLERKKKL